MAFAAGWWMLRRAAGYRREPTAAVLFYILNCCCIALVALRLPFPPSRGSVLPISHFNFSSLQVYRELAFVAKFCLLVFGIAVRLVACGLGLGTFWVK